MAQISFHAHAIAVTILAIGADAVVAAGVADPEWLAEQGTRWFGASTFDPPPRRLSEASQAAGYALRHASVRSVWFINSLRASVAIAAAVAIADLSSVQHGFWVVLGTLSVLRTNAGSTGSTALRALAGTLAGFVIGGALIVAIGTNTAVLWAALPVAVFVAAYSPGTAPFAVGQAAFTVTIAVLFNLLAPVGWRVGVVRIEDVAIGCAVSFAVGILFWPRGVASVVGDDLADAYRTGAMYLTQAVEWVSGLAVQTPDGAGGCRNGRRPARRRAARAARRAGDQARAQGGPVAPGRRFAAAASDRARRGGAPASGRRRDCRVACSADRTDGDAPGLVRQPRRARGQATRSCGRDVDGARARS